MKSCPYCAEEIQAEAVKCKHCGEFLNADAKPQPSTPFSSSNPLTRSSTDSSIAGVCGGLAANLKMDANMVRVLFAVVTFATGIFLGVIAYVVMAVVLPLDRDVAGTNQP